MPTDAHDLGPWQRAVKGVPCRAAQHPEGEGDQGAALGDGGAGAPCERHPGHAKADGVVGGIAEEIERIGLQGRRTGSGTGDDFGHEEPGIDERARSTARAASAGCSAPREGRRRNRRNRDSRPCKRLGKLRWPMI